MSAFFRDKERGSWLPQKKEHVLGEDASLQGYDTKKFFIDPEYVRSKFLRNVDNYLAIGATSLSRRLNLQHLRCDCQTSSMLQLTSTVDEDTLSVTVWRHRCAAIHPSQHTQNTTYGLLLGVNPHSYGEKGRGSLPQPHSFTFYIMASSTLIHPNGLDPLTIRAENTGWELL